jgi:Holliday junction resolvase RusA-like endonuclease
MPIKFTVNSVPIAQPRQRHGVVNGFVRNYTPSDHPVVAFKSYVKWSCKMAFSGAPLTGPLSMRLIFVFPRPKNKIYKNKPMIREWKPSKPDWDNLGKSVCDALNQLLYVDDSQIVCTEVSKCIASGDEAPHVEITVENL